jgi:hypothetical protein
MAKIKLINTVPPDLENEAKPVDEIVTEFAESCEPLETSSLFVMMDARTGARYCECHLRASKILELGTIDVPLDPDEQPEYRANRDIVEDHVAFEAMQRNVGHLAISSPSLHPLLTRIGH